MIYDIINCDHMLHYHPVCREAILLSSIVHAAESRQTHLHQKTGTCPHVSISTNSNQAWPSSVHCRFRKVFGSCKRRTSKNPSRPVKQIA